LFAAVSLVIFVRLRSWPGAILAFALGTGLAGSLLAFLVEVLVLLARILTQMEEGERQLRSLVNVRPLLGEVPLRFSGWAVDPSFAEILVTTLVDARPQLVVECGSGSSTIVIARCLRGMDNGYLVSLEHDENYATRTRNLLQLSGVADRCEVVSAPLKQWERDGQRMLWYGNIPDQTLRDGIDVLVVDGPPGKVAPRARYPAVPILRPYLSRRCIILLDDGDRHDERAIADAWARDLNASPEYVPGGKGLWILRREAAE
jgi:predicted O-methyltransferase YrrM